MFVSFQRQVILFYAEALPVLLTRQGGESNKFVVLFSQNSREPDSNRLNWPLHIVYQESNQSKIRGCVSLEVVQQNHKHGDHYMIVKGHV